MPSPFEILRANIESTRFADLTVDMQITTTGPDPDSKVVHIASKWQPRVHGGTLDVMARITNGNPFDFRFLIQQSSDMWAQPIVESRTPVGTTMTRPEVRPRDQR